VAGVVEAAVDPMADEFNVDEDLLWTMPLPVGMGAWPLLMDWAFSPFVLMLDLLFLRRLLRKEGIARECCGPDVYCRRRNHKRSARRRTRCRRRACASYGGWHVNDGGMSLESREEASDVDDSRKRG
jgi:hypothetical protein